ncbi:isochorismatase hydrolase : Isochorismatase hydrolase OS=Spirosoma linguale (strain ATCC 33905 / DSM 74 / LMG 10896) GN=Slin_1908 PE=4 SV=1: Isochorismatase [Gemmataceae bacterium]|nr:isochorismatase hydrolase : Isochorismatase hydrolase OS=Spirosoma linguale (strain ATCC 33905 / DSM 74 / LMG 10896) GN=Slin_1908 PE=4 SV=1: Isochorismatase [Gemmataceae bacterium]VTU00450.1 isochorismatase hydrolase : Isochorismatase hydrolase OS=Spirosoma linguale (strain ATCC 33905 / DSM 74 / LMG 10896) GN=Slin_1908 PE=4 SV=1: Isochorismatase [Gemmataceae bacterium]
MPRHSENLHGGEPDPCPVALLLVDVINPMDFPEAPQLLRTAVAAAGQLAALKARARAAGAPVVYANDNFGRWRSNLSAVVERCLEPGCAGRPVAEQLLPDPDDYFVIKPKHSAFFSTTLDVLLRHLKVRTVVVGGFAADMCVLFTANDAYMRDLRVVVPADGVASNEPADCAEALALMRRVLSAPTPPAAGIDFAALAATGA